MIRRSGWVAAATAAVVMMVSPAAAQRSSGSSSGSGGGGGGAAHLRAVEREGEIRIDGRLGEAAWERAPVITDFVQGEPVEGAEPEARTEVRLLFDDEAIYVGAHLYEPDPSAIARQLVRRDETGQADYFQVSFDPNLDRRTGYQFRLSAAGVERDAYLFNDNREDASWDAVWDSKVTVDDDGWTVEMRIPWSQIRYEPSDEPQSWGINFQRWRVAAGERTYYALVPRTKHGRVSFFRVLDGVRAPKSLQRIEVRPYALARGHTGPAEAGDPFFTGTESDVQAGFDLRYGLGSAFTLDATVNPDFGQVELDPAVINLSAFETFFPEKRPFFVEDARVLDFNLSGHRNTLFYSRRIGREPQGAWPDDAEYADVPAQSTILGAGKLTGRTNGGLSVGALAAMTGAEEARAFFPGGAGAPDSIGRFLAQPRGYYGVTRVQQDFREGATTVGAIVTGLRRDLPGDGSFDFLTSDAYSAGVNFEHMWGDRAWALQGFLAGSLVQGDTAALVRIQESSNHYFQRPDSRYAVDSTRTALTGMEWRLEFQRRSGEHWTGAAWVAEVTPGFEVNDLGYSRSSERVDGGARVSYHEVQPGPVFRDYGVSASLYSNWRHAALDDPFSFDSWGRAQKDGSLNVSARGTLNSFWGASIDARYQPEVLDDGATRGGPLMVRPAGLGTGLRLHTDPREAVTLSGSLNYDTGVGGESLRGGLGVTFRPTPGWEVRLSPSLSTQRTTDQYVGAFDDPAFAPTYGRRYVFGELERRSASLETRLNVTFTPSLTLQLFAQPLIEAGRYTAYKQLARAESFDFTPFHPGLPIDVDGNGVLDRCDGGTLCRLGDSQYVDFNGDGLPDESFDDRDFNVVSLRGNAVLRWEYRPGSTLFLVWQQRRYARRDFGDFDPGREAGDMLDLQPDNVFIVKANYWLGL